MSFIRQQPLDCVAKHYDVANSFEMLRTMLRPTINIVAPSLLLERFSNVASVW
jgi:hypothetical protein